MCHWNASLVIDRVQRGDDIVTLTIRPAADWPSPAIGSHIKVWAPGADAAGRLYTICNAPQNDDDYQIAIKRVPKGLTSGYIWDAAVPGTVLHISSPIPGFDYAPAMGTSVALIAGGIGITPFRAFVASYRPEGDGRVHLIYVVRSASNEIFLDELESQSRRCSWLDVDVFLTRDVSQPAYRAHDRFRIHHSRPTTQALRGILAVSRPIHVYYSGPKPLGHHAFAAALDAGVAPSSFHCEHAISLPAAKAPADLRIVILDGSKRFPVQTGQTILDAALQAKILSIEHSCRVGLCHVCKVRVVQGSVRSVGVQTLGEAERGAGYHLACCSVPESDLQLESL